MIVSSSYDKRIFHRVLGCRVTAWSLLWSHSGKGQLAREIIFTFGAFSYVSYQLRKKCRLTQRDRLLHPQYELKLWRVNHEKSWKMVQSTDLCPLFQKESSNVPKVGRILQSIYSHSLFHRWKGAYTFMLPWRKATSLLSPTCGFQALNFRLIQVISTVTYPSSQHRRVWNWKQNHLVMDP